MRQGTEGEHVLQRAHLMPHGQGQEELRLVTGQEEKQSGFWVESFERGIAQHNFGKIGSRQLCILRGMVRNIYFILTSVEPL